MPADRIAVLRGGGLGDLVFALPALEALRARFPAAEITLIGEPWLEGLAVGRRAVEGGPTLVDRHVALPPRASAWLAGRGGPEDASDAAAVARQVAARPPDLAIQLHGGGRHSNPFVSSLGAPVTAGLRAPDAPALNCWVPYVYYQSEVLRALEVVGLLGATPVSVEPRLLPAAPADAPLHGDAPLAGEAPVPADAPLQGDAPLAAALRAVRPDDDRPLAVLHPAASDPR